MSLLESDLVIIRVIRAINLISKEDVYCIVRTNQDDSASDQKKQIRRTHLAEKTNNPEWGNEFVIPITRANSLVVEFQVMDQNKITKDVLMGGCSLVVDASQFPLNEEVKRVVPLENAKRGDVEVAVRIVRVNGG